MQIGMLPVIFVVCVPFGKREYILHVGGVCFLWVYICGVVCQCVCVCLLLRRQAGGGGGVDMTNCQEECSGPLLSLSWYGHGVKLAHEGNKLF